MLHAAFGLGAVLCSLNGTVSMRHNPHSGGPALLTDFDPNLSHLNKRGVGGKKHHYPVEKGFVGIECGGRGTEKLDGHGTGLRIL